MENHNVLSQFQSGSVKGWRTTDNVSVIKTTVDKCLTFKRGIIYWCFIDFEKTFDLIDRDMLWYKMQRKTGSERMMNCISSK
jgi:hypothetical protein